MHAETERIMKCVRIAPSEIILLVFKTAGTICSVVFLDQNDLDEDMPLGHKTKGGRLQVTENHTVT